MSWQCKTRRDESCAELMSSCEENVRKWRKELSLHRLVSGCFEHLSELPGENLYVCILKLPKFSSSLRSLEFFRILELVS